MVASGGKIENYCVKCDNINCTCYNYDVFTCTGCANDAQIFVKSPGIPSCYDSCLQVSGVRDTYYDKDSKTCEKCDGACGSCWGPTNNECYDCVGKNILSGESSCIEIVCPDGYYLPDDAKTPECLECPETCLTCKSPGTASDCIKCVPDRMMSESLCLPCNLIVGYQYPIRSNICTEICGDGIDLERLGCDDGNVRNGDGCSSSCEIERGWECSGGDSETPDTCMYIVNPQPVILKSNSDLKYWIGFSQSMTSTLSG